MINKKLFIACPIAKYLKEDGIDKEFETFIKGIISFCRENYKEVYIALEREEFGKNKMYGSECTIPDYVELNESDVLLAIPEDSMGVSVEIGWASANRKEVIVLVDKKYKQSELVKAINCITPGTKIEIDSTNGYNSEIEKIHDELNNYFKNLS